jgi:hypothetical protein
VGSGLLVGRVDDQRRGFVHDDPVARLVDDLEIGRPPAELMMKSFTKKPETRERALALEEEQSSLTSGLVAQTLLVAVLLHALLALVLVDLGFTAFLDGAHGVCGRGWFAVKGMVRGRFC